MDDNLAVLVGDWDLAGEHPELGSLALGSATFEWMRGGGFLIQSWASAQPQFPSGLAAIGPADGSGSYRQHYFDSRGVVRVYEMTLGGGVWTLERRDDDFWQRFRGELSADGRTITGAWEIAKVGGEYELDFGMTFTRAG